MNSLLKREMGTADTTRGAALKRGGIPLKRGKARHQPLGRERSIRALAIAVVAAAGLVAAGYHSKPRLAAGLVRADVQALPEYLPDVRFLRLVSLGYENAVADFLWFRTINYFGVHYRTDRVYPWLARMCDLVTDLDPRAEHVYAFGGVILPWEAGLPDEGIAILEKGIRTFPRSWRLHFLLGFNYFFFKNDTASALPYIRRATELPGVHPFVSRLAAMLYSEQHGLDTARAFLEELQASEVPDDLRAVIAERLKDVQLTADIAALERAVAAYRDRFGALPRSLADLVASGLLGSLPSEPFGGTYVYDPGTGTVASSRGRLPLRSHLSPIRSQIQRRQAPRR